MFTFFSRTAKVAILTLIFLFSSTKAHAYIDPGSGSYFLQLLIAGLLGGLYALKLFWHKIVAFFKNLFSRGKKVEKVKK